MCLDCSESNPKRTEKHEAKNGLSIQLTSHFCFCVMIDLVLLYNAKLVQPHLKRFYEAAVNKSNS